MPPNNNNNNEQTAVAKPFQSKSYLLWGATFGRNYLVFRNEYLELLFQRLAVSDSENFELCAFENEFFLALAYAGLYRVGPLR